MDLLLDLLAVRRIVRLVVHDEIAQPLREAAENAHPKLETLVNCELCVSVWGALATLVVPKSLRRALALSEASILIGQVPGLAASE